MSSPGGKVQTSACDPAEPPGRQYETAVPVESYARSHAEHQYTGPKYPTAASAS